MRTLVERAADEDVRTAEDFIKGLKLPQDITGFTVDAGEDQDGDPVVVVWFNVDDPNRPDRGPHSAAASFRRGCP